MILRGKVSYVISSVVIDADISFPFGIHVQRRIWLADVPPVQNDEAATKRAAHCAVILLGGKKIFIDLPDSDNPGRTLATVYRDFEDGIVEAFEPEFQQTLNIDNRSVKVVNVNKYLKHLSTTNYQVDDVRQRVIPQRVG